MRFGFDFDLAGVFLEVLLLLLLRGGGVGSDGVFEEDTVFTRDCFCLGVFFLAVDFLAGDNVTSVFFDDFLAGDNITSIFFDVFLAGDNVTSVFFDDFLPGDNITSIFFDDFLAGDNVTSVFFFLEGLADFFPMGERSSSRTVKVFFILGMTAFFGEGVDGFWGTVLRARGRDLLRTKLDCAPDIFFRGDGFFRAGEEFLEGDKARFLGEDIFFGEVIFLLLCCVLSDFLDALATGRELRDLDLEVGV